jgi:TM2 domain-containing membrane protein YozV
VKSLVAAHLLWFFFGCLSAHRFYLGKWVTGLIYLVTFQLFGIGWIIDAFIMPMMVNSANRETRIYVNQ